jgi:hypothetical protein
MLDLSTATKIARELKELKGNKTLLSFIEEIRNTDMETLTQLLRLNKETHNVSR